MVYREERLADAFVTLGGAGAEFEAARLPYVLVRRCDELLAADGVGAVVVVPIGFVSDHMEVVWDLDTEAAATAAGHGMLMVRVPTPGVHPAFVAGLVDLVVERLEDVPDDERPHVTALGPWPDLPALGAVAGSTR